MKKILVTLLVALTLDDARRVMEADDAVREQLMTAQLFPFGVALVR